jgi:hypothetical protein
LLERYVAAVNGNDVALLREVFAEPYIQHGGIKGSRNIFPALVKSKNVGSARHFDREIASWRQT